MKVLILGSGMMGRAIAFGLNNHSDFDRIAIADKDRKSLKSAELFLNKKDIDFDILNVEKENDVRKKFQEYDVVISAIPYNFNYNLTKLSIETKTHFLDLGGNNEIVNKQKKLDKVAKQNNVTIIPDCGLAPGLASVIVRDIVENLDSVDYVKMRVGGLPLEPIPPLNYQIVFSPNGLINEYVEDAIALDNGKIVTKKSMTEIEKIVFPQPFGELEAFNTSGGCSTLPYTYKDKIGYLDYKTIRYLGHCEEFKPLLKLKSRDELIKYLTKNLPHNEKDVVLMKIFAKGKINNENKNLEYTTIDYYDEKNNITSMMRTTGYPVSIIAQMIEKGSINNPGVYCNEEIVPPGEFFKQLEKRNIKVTKEVFNG